ncbi:hypothetical protein K432DRAFT_384187 [Lepidopterella palustris CBS 459.81]|uniref:Pre-rRNA-processing protein RIX1 n=1 Tax=Lepidopterella palustris CBS 459.81 TaxID=1314670 RepID=A0A8E2E6E1_9PEZI|nr:hypothetical protein K432DRAFT_384187 [Lepidopterella palustris CBS 459.81]
MAPQPAITSATVLRAITTRISSTPTPQLAQQIPAISASLPQCKELLSSLQLSSSRDSSESSVVAHKYRTQLSTLIQDRTAQGRWCGIVLIKSTIEIGGWETLWKSGPWVRGLLSILMKPDPPTSKILCIITLTRIFMLTRDYPTVVREITTPSLPTFIQSCLGLATSKGASSLLKVVLDSFHQLLPRHPTIFRSYLSRIQQVLGPVLAPTPSNKFAKGPSYTPAPYVSADISRVARQLYVQQHHCAPKSASTEEWQISFTCTLLKIHKVADSVFRAVIEDWRSVSGVSSTVTANTLGDKVQDLATDAIGLPGWAGLYAGSERLIGLLGLLTEYLNSPTATPVNLRVGSIMDLLTRMFSVTVPSSGNEDSQNANKLNSQISREERESLWEVLPNIHVAAVDLMLSLLGRLGDAFIPVVPIVLDQLLWVFSAENNILQIRTAIYSSMSELLKLSGPSLTRSTIKSLDAIIRRCCNDLLSTDLSKPELNSTTATPKGSAASQSSANADSFLGSSTGPKTPPSDFAGLKAAASALLPILLSKLPSQHISESARTRLDRTAILLRDKEAMIASVLNPPPSKKSLGPAASIIPLLARAYTDSTNVEGLLRPRMPVARIGKGALDSESEDESEDDVEEESHAYHLSNPLDQVTKPNEIAHSAIKSFLHNDTEMIDSSTPKQLSLDTTSANLPTASTDANAVPTSAKRSQAEAEEDHRSPPSPKRARLQSPPQLEASIPAQRTHFCAATAATFIPSVIAPMPTIPKNTGESTTISPIVVASAGIASRPLNTTTPPASAETDSDSDNDNFGTLVLGQDTDDEEDA